MNAQRFTRLPSSTYPANIAAAIAIADNETLKFSARQYALQILRQYFTDPSAIPLRPALIASLDAGQLSVQ